MSDGMVGGSYEIGIDTGGTFTDIVCRSADGAIRLMKLPSTPGNPGRAVLAALTIIAQEWDIPTAAIKRLTHGTTVATNAVLERKGARVGLITTQGFRDVLEIGRQIRRSMYDIALVPQTPVFLAPRRFRKEVVERLDATGAIVIPLDEASVRLAVAELVASGVEAIAICLLFSFLDPTHEQRIRAMIAEIAPGLPVSLSSEVDPTFREYERTCVTAFDSYIKPVVAHYLADMEEKLAEGGMATPLQVIQSRGGLASSAIARQRPVRLFLSGPAAGVVGGTDVGVAAGYDNLITVDIGGTSCDIALVSQGKPLIRAEGLIDGYTVRVPMVDVTAIGSGGGSIAWLDGAGSLRVGPQSAGADPGPACYGRGGTQATVTDASVVLGYIDPGNFAGGSLRLDPAAAREAIERCVAGPLDLTVEAAALGIHRVLNAQMAEAIRLISIGRGIDPREYALLPLGGGGPMHGTPLAEELGISRVVVPPHPGVLAAAGLLGAPIEHEMTTAFPSPLAGMDLVQLRGSFAALDERCRALMQAELVAEAEIETSHFVDICYIGQSYHLEVACDLAAADPLGAVYEAFLIAHDRVYGHCTRHPAKIVNIRVVQRSQRGRVAGGAQRNAKEAGRMTQRRIRVRQSGDWVQAAIWPRAAMRPGITVAGPAIIEQIDTTTLVEPGWVAQTLPSGALLIERVAP